MSGLGELIVFMLYATLGSSAIICILLLIVANTKLLKSLYLIGFLFSATLFVLYYNYKSSSHRASELEYVGTYYLTDFPNCVTCKLVLNADNTYDVRNENSVIETGDWHYESGGDYWIVYINKKGDQLGAGRFAYKRYDNRYKAAKRITKRIEKRTHNSVSYVYRHLNRIVSLFFIFF